MGCNSNQTLHRAARCSARVVSMAVLAQRNTSALEKQFENMLFSWRAQLVCQNLTDYLFKPFAAARFQASYQHFKSQVPQLARKGKNLAVKDRRAEQI